MILTTWNFGTLGTEFLESSYRVLESKKVAQNPVPAVPKFHGVIQTNYISIFTRSLGLTGWNTLSFFSIMNLILIYQLALFRLKLLPSISFTANSIV